MPKVSVSALIGQIPRVVGSVEKFIDVCAERDTARHRAAFMNMARGVHELFAPFIKKLPEEEVFLDVCEDAYETWVQGGK